MDFYDILEIKKEWVEQFSITSVTKLECLLLNSKTKNKERKIVTFFQLVDLYSAKLNKYFCTSDKIKVEKC